MQTLLAHAPFGSKLDAGSMLATQRELEARLQVWVCETEGGLRLFVTSLAGGGQARSWAKGQDASAGGTGAQTC